MMPLTNKEKSYIARKKKKKKKCYICKKALSTDDDNKTCHKIRAHCHYTRKYRRAALDICNLQYKTPKEFL